MKTTTILSISAAALVISGAVFLNLQPGNEPGPIKSPPSVTKISKSSRKAERKAAVEVVNTDPGQESDPVTNPTDPEEAEHLAQWKSRFDVLVAEHGDRGEAVRILLAEVDAVFSKWVRDEITLLEKLPPAERYDRLALMETSVQEGAAAVLEQVGIEGSRQATVAAGALELVSAESQYAETAPDPAARLAMLRLDRERESRLGEALSIGDDVAKSKAMSELDNWYETALAAVFPSDESN